MPLIATIFAKLRTRPGVLFLLVYQALFLNVIVPGHTRGIITLSGHVTVSGESALGCCMPQRDSGSHHVPTQKNRENCAICHQAARYTPPPVVDFRLDKIELVELLAFPTPAVIHSCDFTATYYACGPPLNA